MKKVSMLLRILLCGLFMVSGLAFGAIQGFQLFSGDWLLFENQGLALAQILGKGLLALYCFAICLKAALRPGSPSPWSGVQLMAITLAAAPFVSNHLGWLFVALAAVLLLLQLAPGFLAKK